MIVVSAMTFRAHKSSSHNQTGLLKLFDSNFLRKIADLFIQGSLQLVP